MKPHTHPARRLGAVAGTLLFAAAQGCGPSKAVVIRSTPDRAVLTLYKVTSQGQVRVPLDGDEATTPATVKLDFTDGAQYKVDAHRVLCAPSLNTPIRLDPVDQVEYAVKLTQFKQFVTALVYHARQAGDLWRMVADPTETVATIDTAEPNPTYVDQPAPVTDNPRGDVDFPSFAVAAAPTGTVMVYERAARDSSIPGGLDSKLFKLPLGPGNAATTLTLSRAQQHNPAFSYLGDEVIFDSNDDSRTRGPVKFVTASNESTLTQLQHDSDTCETEFSAGRDALAFTAHVPNAPVPQVMVAGLDGSGPTPRGKGHSPQIEPNGNRVVFVHPPEDGGPGRLALVNVRGPISLVELQLNAEHAVRDPHWSPDGKLIVYCSDLRDGEAADLAREPDPAFREPDADHSFLWVVTADGHNPIQLTHGENYDSDPTFDPDGRTIYFRSNRGGTWNIWKCSLTDAAMAKLGGGR